MGLTVNLSPSPLLGGGDGHKVSVCEATEAAVFCRGRQRPEDTVRGLQLEASGGRVQVYFSGGQHLFCLVGVCMQVASIYVLYLISQSSTCLCAFSSKLQVAVAHLVKWGVFRNMSPYLTVEGKVQQLLRVKRKSLQCNTRPLSQRIKCDMRSFLERSPTFVCVVYTDRAHAGPAELGLMCGWLCGEGTQ